MEKSINLFKRGIRFDMEQLYPFSVYIRMYVCIEKQNIDFPKINTLESKPQKTNILFIHFNVRYKIKIRKKSRSIRTTEICLKYMILCDGSMACSFLYISNAIQFYQ